MKTKIRELRKQHKLSQEELLDLVDSKLSGTALAQILGLAEDVLIQTLSGLTEEQRDILEDVIIGTADAPVLEDKLTETEAMKQKLAEAGIDIEIDETGTTFTENARIKARAVWEARKADGLDYDPEAEDEQPFLAQITKYNLRNID